jgi:hypothetical protein
LSTASMSIRKGTCGSAATDRPTITSSSSTSRAAS